MLDNLKDDLERIGLTLPVTPGLVRLLHVIECCMTVVDGASHSSLIATCMVELRQALNEAMAEISAALAATAHSTPTHHAGFLVVAGAILPL
ncbi:hypothetical protein Q8W71_26060 [Methylobacterium sp. NEAU 140]|uniref:hypothetical protein n=1 Tax=Methylobacterium sp. NEAU 140 TaxID=3064945 RepID=UPI002734C2AB|nr:hypothetical protein [Methylobacterium sp. NEAU 140]MDP4026098.1 hypothetical protein [Methylobacterium sp. NEAU 140]